MGATPEADEPIATVGGGSEHGIPSSQLTESAGDVAGSHTGNVGANDHNWPGR